MTIHICKDERDTRIYGVFSTLDLAIKSAKLSYSKLFELKFITDGKLTTVYSQTDKVILLIEEVEVYTRVEHL